MSSQASCVARRAKRSISLGHALCWSLLIGGLLNCPRLASAADIIFTGANDPGNTNPDSWNDPLNWNPNQLPGSGDRADVAGGLTANIASGTTTVNTLYVGADDSQNSPGDGFTNANGNPLTTGNGTLIQSGGSLSVSTGMVLGQEAGFTGTMTIQNNAAVTVTGTNNPSLTVGDSGTGVFNIGGSATYNQANGDIFIGNNSGSNGSVVQTGGTVNLHSSNNWTYIGHGGGSTGSYTISGGSLTDGGSNGVASTNNGHHFDVGQNGAGTLTVNGTGTATFDLLGVAGIDGGGAAVGNVNLADSGTIRAQTLNTSSSSGSLATIMQSGGTFNLAGDSRLSTGSGGVTNFTQTGGSFTSNNLAFSSTAGGMTTVNVGGTFTVNGQLWLGDNGTATVNISSGGHLITNNQDSFIGNNNGATGNIVQTGGQVQFHPTTGQWTFIGNNNGATGTYTMSGGTVSENNRIYIGSNGSGTFTQTGGTTSFNEVHMTQGSTGVGQLNISQNAQFNANLLVVGDGGQATANIQGGAVNINGRILVGTGGHGAVTQSGGDIIGAQDVSVGDNNGSSTTANPDTYTMSGGTLTTANGLLLGWNGHGTFTQTSGVVTANGNGVQLGGGSTGGSSDGQGIYNLNGGTLATSQIYQHGGATAGHQFNFNGGTLRATGSAGSYIFVDTAGGNLTANVRNGGAMIDVNGFPVTINQPLVHSTILGDNGVDGGLTLKGTAGTLTLNGTNTYTGSTRVNVGTLALGGGSTNNIANSGSIQVAGGATLDVTGLSGGTLTLSSPQSISASGTGTATVNGSIVAPVGSTVLGNLAAQLSVSNLSLNGGGTAFSLAGVNTATPMINVTGPNGLAVNASTPITIASPQAGTFELFGYNGTVGGSLSNFGTPTGPSTYLYTLDTTSNPGFVDLNVVVNNNNVTWTGYQGGNGTQNDNWTTSVGDTNWTVAGLATNYHNGATVTFQDTNPLGAAPDGTVNIQAAGVQPASTTFSNTTLPYVVNSAAATPGIAGAGDVIINAGGTVTFTGPNTYSGTTRIQSGTLVLGSGSGTTGSISSSGALVLGSNAGNTAGVLVLGDASNPVTQTLSSISTSGTGANAIVGGNAATSTLRVNVTGTDTYNGMLGGAGANQNNLALSVTGGGTLELGSANTYSGQTSVLNGTLAVTAPGGNLPIGGVVVLGDSVNNTAGFLQIGNAATAYSPTISSSSISQVGAGASGIVGGNAAVETLSFSGASPINVSATIGGAGANQNNLALRVNGAGVVTVSGANTFNGGTTIDAGTLAIPADADSGPAPLGPAPGSPTTNITIGNNGTLRTTNSLTLSTNRSIVLSGGEATIDTQANNVAYAGSITGGGQFNKAGSGTLTYTGIGTVGNLWEDAGTLVLDTGASVLSNGFASISRVNPGAGFTTAALTVQGTGSVRINGDFNMSDLTGTIGILNIQDSGAASGNTLYVGKNGNAQGYVNQSGGSFSQFNGGGDWRIGGGTGTNDTASFGSYVMTGGTFSTNDNFQIGAFGTGIMSISGAATASADNGFPSVGRFAGGFGVLDVSGGSFTQNNSGTRMIVGEQGTGVLNVRGTGVVTVTSSDPSIAFNLGLNGGNGTVNLLTGGMIQTLSVSGGTGAGTFNFNGGTLQAQGSTTTFVHNLTNAYVYANGGIIDTNGSDVTISQGLQAPGGQGVVAPTISDGGTGYLAAPVVKITGGGGTGATAIAQVTAGVVTGITITSPGVGYTSAPTISLVGGNPTAGALLATANLVNNTSGDVTKIGGGTLTLSGVNTYGGATRIQGGTLRIVTTPQAGLYEGIIANGTNAFDTTSSIPQTTAYLTTRLANSTAQQQQYPAGIPDNSTVGYTGTFVNSTGTTQNYTFGEFFDDSVLLKIDGTQVLNDTQWNVQTQGSISLSPGPHTFELRLGQGNGGVGPSNTNGENGVGNSGLGVGYNTDGSNTFLPITDPGDGSLLLTGASTGLPTGTSVIMSSNTTFDMTNQTQTIGSLSDVTGGPAPTGHQVLIGSGALTTGGDNTSTTYSGAISLAGGSLTKTGSGVFNVTGALSAGSNSTIAVNGTGTLRVTGNGSTTIGSTVTATVATGATLDLAGSVSALGVAGGNKTKIINDGNLTVSGTNQVVGAVTATTPGNGSVTVEDGNDLTVDSINQGSLSIGVASTFTIDASDSNGNPLVAAAGGGGSSKASLGLTHLLASRSFASGLSSSSLVSGSVSSANSGASLGGATLSASTAAVPEPSSIGLLLMAAAGMGSFGAIRRRRAAR